MLEPSAPFPNFSLPNQDGKFVSLKDFKGKWLVIYVYPKDDTPGCTIQGKSFTATQADFRAANIEVVGVSSDDVNWRVADACARPIDRISSARPEPCSAEMNTGFENVTKSSLRDSEATHCSRS